MIQTTVEKAQINLAHLLERVREGEEVVIEENGKALARIVGVDQDEAAQYNPNWFGMDEGKGWIAPDFNETPEDIINSFYGENE